ncbi:MAG: GtrA family protein [Eubacteriales bacterium]|nr:GtrA family protein [Eubacteriales bacterium]
MNTNEKKKERFSGAQWKKRLWTPLKYIVSSLTGTALDYSLFYSLYTLAALPRTPVFVGARLCGAVVNFLLNRFVVFKKKDRLWKSLLWDATQYALLSLCTAGGALLILNALADRMGVPTMLAKVMADMTMFALGYVVQRFVIFRKKKTTPVS